jgi:Fanconi anemia group M protein
MSTYLEHPLLKNETVEKRLFQLDLAATALKSSSLIVVPTGLGKTVIALMVLLARLDRGKILFLAPTKPLVEQHATFLGRVQAGTVFTLPLAISASASVYTPPIAIFGGA